MDVVSDNSSCTTARVISGTELLSLQILRVTIEQWELLVKLYSGLLRPRDLRGSGLLPLLKSIQKPCNLKKFAGQTIGVDAYGWLHRGTVACAIELALGKPTTK